MDAGKKENLAHPPNGDQSMGCPRTDLNPAASTKQVHHVFLM